MLFNGCWRAWVLLNVSGADEKRRKDDVIYDQRSLMEGMKRYFFLIAGDERNVAVEQDGAMRTLPGGL
jgi:hypothetical protein